MRHAERQTKIQGFRKAFFGLVGHAEHHIERNIVYPRRLRRFHRRFDRLAVGKSAQSAAFRIHGGL